MSPKFKILDHVLLLDVYSQSFRVAESHDTPLPKTSRIYEIQGIFYDSIAGPAGQIYYILKGLPGMFTEVSLASISSSGTSYDVHTNKPTTRTCEQCKEKEKIIMHLKGALDLSVKTVVSAVQGEYNALAGWENSLHDRSKQ